MATFLFVVFVLPCIIILLISFFYYLGPPLIAAGLFYWITGMEPAFVFIVLQVGYLIWLAEGEAKREANSI
jgi:chromate transport protein ChrA